MQKESKNKAMTGAEPRVKQAFTFAPQDGVQAPTVIEAETIEEATVKFQKTIKNT